MMRNIPSSKPRPARKIGTNTTGATLARPVVFVPILRAGLGGKRSLNFDRESRPAFRGFSQKQDCNLLERTTKLRSPGCFIAQDRHLGRDKRMLEQMNITGYARLIHRNDLNRAALPEKRNRAQPRS